MRMEMNIKQVYFSYRHAEIIKGIDASFKGPGLHAVFGPNGSGKTTLLKCCTGILTPRKGAIYLNNQKIQSMSCKERGINIAYVPQEHQLSFPFTVREVVLMGRTPHLGGLGNPTEKDAEYADMAIEEIGIQDIAKQPYTQLSGGQRQLVLLARAIAQDTSTVILDEPTSALDFKNQLKVFEILKKMTLYGKLVIVCTHDPNHVKWFCEQVLILKDGTVLEQGKPDKVLNQTCLEKLYGSICHLQDGMIVPNLA